MSNENSPSSHAASTLDDEALRRAMGRSGSFNVWLERHQYARDRHPFATDIADVILYLAPLLNQYNNPQGVALQQLVTRWFFDEFGRPVNGHALLYYCVAAAIGFGRGMQVHAEGARNRYLNSPEMWRSILGDLIPQEFIAANSAAVARKSFHSTASIANADLDTYLSQIIPRSRERNGRYLDSTIATLNDKLGGGFHGLTEISGDKGIGKSSIAAATMHQSLMTDNRLGAIYLQLDGSKQTLLDRLLCRHLDIEYRTLREILSDETSQTSLHQANQDLQELLGRVAIIQRTEELIQNGLSLGLVKDQMQLLRGNGCRTFMVVIDLFNRIDCPPNHREESLKDEYRLDFIKQISKLNKLDQPLGVPVIAVCELRKGSGGRRDMSHDEILGPSRLASDADIILMLESDGDATPESCVQKLCVNITKGRDGVIRGKLPIWFEHAKTRFHSYPPTGTSRGRTSRNSASGGRNRSVPNTQVGTDVNS